MPHNSRTSHQPRLQSSFVFLRLSSLSLRLSSAQPPPLSASIPTATTCPTLRPSQRTSVSLNSPTPASNSTLATRSPSILPKLQIHEPRGSKEWISIPIRSGTQLGSTNALFLRVKTKFARRIIDAYFVSFNRHPSPPVYSHEGSEKILNDSTTATPYLQYQCHVRYLLWPLKGEITRCTPPQPRGPIFKACLCDARILAIDPAEMLIDASDSVRRSDSA